MSHSAFIRLIFQMYYAIIIITLKYISPVTATFIIALIFTFPNSTTEKKDQRGFRPTIETFVGTVNTGHGSCRLKSTHNVCPNWLGCNQRSKVVTDVSHLRVAMLTVWLMCGNDPGSRMGRPT